MFAKIIGALVLILGVIAVIAATRSDDFSVTRTATMAAPPAKIFEQVNNLHNWEAWSPWAKLDPNAKSSYEGPEAGVGATMKWSGNMDVGEGSMTINDSKPNEHIGFQLDFVKPMKGTNAAEFNFKPQGGQTEVTWSMTGKMNFMSKVMSLFMNCEKMVGEQFDKGLASLKTIVEAK